MCITFVRKYISNLPKDQIFVTRDVLPFGSRAAVDKALSRLVNLGLIVRLARGVFIPEHAKTPTIWQIASAKARAFNKLIGQHAGALAYELGFVDRWKRKSTFSVVGRSSSFRAGDRTIYFKGICARKLVFNDSKAGRAVRALWHLGRKQCTYIEIREATSQFNRTDRQEFRQFRSWMPTWLTIHF